MDRPLKLGTTEGGTGFAIIVTPLVMGAKARELCRRPYHNHPRGCPNYDRKRGCPPHAPVLGKVLDLSATVWAVWNEFPFGEHCERMRARPGKWTEPQVRCCLYWQGRARKALKRWIVKHGAWMALTGADADFDRVRVAPCPEACGVDLTATMRAIGVELEWPPEKIARQIVLMGRAPREPSGPEAPGEAGAATGATCE